MNFYDFRVKSIGDSKYAWASGYGPIAHNIDDIPFLKDASDAFKKKRAEFWERCAERPGISLDPGGKEWPDFLGCGLGTPSFFVSEKVLTDLRNAGVAFLRATEIPLIQPFPKKLRDEPPPAYYVLEGISGLEASWKAMGIPHDNDNRGDFSRGLPKPWPPAEWKVSLSSWTGLDLVSYKNWQMPMTLVCTDKIKDIAKAREWTNIKFRTIVTVE